jgi:large subunit ribosomal protein L28
MQHCAICDKKPIVGRSISRRGLAKKSGGIGKKITGISRRRFYPNLQKVKARFQNGTVRRILVCAGCLQAGKVVKAASFKLQRRKEAAASAAK